MHAFIHAPAARALAPILLAVSASHVWATEVEWLPSWKAKDRAAYEVTRCKPIKAEGQTVDTCVKGRLDIVVLRANATSSLQRWNSDILGEALASSGLAPEALATLREAMRFSMDIEFDGAAQPVRLLNGDEIRQKLKAVYSMRTLSKDGKPLDAKALAATEAFVGQLLGSDARLLALMAKDANILYSPLGGSFTIGQTVQVESSMPSPFGSAPFKSTLSVTTQAGGAGTRELQLDIIEDLDRNSLAAALDDIVKPLVGNLGKPEAAAEMRAAFSSMTLRRNSRYRIQPASSWPLLVNWRQSLEVSGQSRLEVTEFKRLQ